MTYKNVKDAFTYERRHACCPACLSVDNKGRSGYVLCWTCGEDWDRITKLLGFETETLYGSSRFNFKTGTLYGSTRFNRFAASRRVLLMLSKVV